MPEFVALVEHQLDHIVAAKHGGEARLENLALCCAVCNKHKGTDLASIDPESGEMLRLFDPRRDRWYEHFELRGAEIVARTGVGRVTVRLLRLNRTERLREREILLTVGLLP
jgi:hypothetical protein